MLAGLRLGLVGIFFRFLLIVGQLLFFVLIFLGGRFLLGLGNEQTFKRILLVGFGILVVLRLDSAVGIFRGVVLNFVL